MCWWMSNVEPMSLQDNPDAKLEDLEKPGADEEPQQVLLRWVAMTTSSVTAE